MPAAPPAPLPAGHKRSCSHGAGDARVAGARHGRRGGLHRLADRRGRRQRQRDCVWQACGGRRACIEAACDWCTPLEALLQWGGSTRVQHTQQLRTSWTARFAVQRNGLELAARNRARLRHRGQPAAMALRCCSCRHHQHDGHQRQSQPAGALCVHATDVGTPGKLPPRSPRGPTSPGGAQSGCLWSMCWCSPALRRAIGSLPAPPSSGQCILQSSTAAPSAGPANREGLRSHSAGECAVCRAASKQSWARGAKARDENGRQRSARGRTHQAAATRRVQRVGAIEACCIDGARCSLVLVVQLRGSSIRRKPAEQHGRRRAHVLGRGHRVGALLRCVRWPSRSAFGASSPAGEPKVKALAVPAGQAARAHECSSLTAGRRGLKQGKPDAGCPQSERDGRGARAASWLQKHARASTTRGWAHALCHAAAATLVLPSAPGEAVQSTLSTLVATEYDAVGACMTCSGATTLVQLQTNTVFRLTGAPGTLFPSTRSAHHVMARSH